MAGIAEERLFTQGDAVRFGLPLYAEMDKLRDEIGEVGDEDVAAAIATGAATGLAFDEAATNLLENPSGFGTAVDEKVNAAVTPAVQTAVDPAVLVGDSVRFNILPGEADLGLQRVMNFAGKGQRIKFVGDNLTLTRAVNIDGTKFLSIDFAGVRVVRGAGVTMLNCTAPVDAPVKAVPYNVGTVEVPVMQTVFEVTEGVDAGSQSHTTDAVYFDSIPSSWAEGTSFRAISDDIIDGENYNLGDTGHMRLGEWCHIYRIDPPSGDGRGYRVLFTTKFRDNYKTNMQFARVVPASVNIYNLTADVTEDVWTSRVSGRTLRLTCLLAPKVEGTRIIRETNYPISLRATLAAHVLDTFVHRLANNPEAGQYGYAIHEASTEDSVIERLNSLDGRHAWTDGIGLVSARNERVTFGTIPVKEVTLTGVTSGTFALTYNGQTTAPLPYDASSASVKAALEALSNVGAGKVTASALTGASVGYSIFFDLTATPKTLTGTASVGTVAVKDSTAPGVTGGTFTLTYNGQVTSALAYNATADTVQTALRALPALANVGIESKVSVTGSGPNAYTVSFADDVTTAAFSAQSGSLTGPNPTLTIARIAPVVWDYGRVQNAKIIASTARATSQSAWDTHHGSRNVQFIMCTAYASGVKNCFSLRGENHSIIDCIMIGGGTGVRITTEDYSGESRRHHIVNPRISGVARAFAIEIRQGANHPQLNVRDLAVAATISGVYADDVGSLLWAYNCKVEMSIEHLRFSSTISIPPIFNYNSEVAISIAPGKRWNGLGVTKVLTPSTSPVGSAQDFIRTLGGAGLTSLVGAIDLSDQWIAALDQNRLLYPATSSGVQTTDGLYIDVELNKYISDTPFPVMGMNAYDVKWKTRQTQNGAASTRRHAGARELSNADITLDAQVEYVGIGSYDVLYLSFVITDSTSRTLGRLPVGHFNGQRLLLHLRSSNDVTKTVTVASNAGTKRTVFGALGSLVLSTDTTSGNLATGELVWNGGAWYRGR